MLRKQLIWQDCEWHLTLLPLIFARRIKGKRNKASIQTYLKRETYDGDHIHPFRE